MSDSAVSPEAVAPTHLPLVDPELPLSPQPSAKKVSRTCGAEVVVTAPQKEVSTVPVFHTALTLLTFHPPLTSLTNPPTTQD